MQCMISKSNVKFTDSNVKFTDSEARTWRVENKLCSPFVVICFKTMYNKTDIKQLLDSVFVIPEIIKVSVIVIRLSLRLRLITLTSTLIIPDITKTPSNNCLMSVEEIGERNS